MESINNFKSKLDMLDSMLRQLHSSHSRVQQLKRSVYVLKKILKNPEHVKSAYGPATPIVRFSVQ